MYFCRWGKFWKNADFNLRRCNKRMASEAIFESYKLKYIVFALFLGLFLIFCQGAEFNARFF